MFIFTKNILLFLYYSTICFLMLTGHVPYVKGFYFSFFPFMMVYYLVMLFPRVHHKYYFVLERSGVPWKFWIVYFHTCISSGTGGDTGGTGGDTGGTGGTGGIYVTTAILAYVYLYKDLWFIIKFSEQRLAKIEETIEDKMPSFRIAHLHLNVFEEDKDNRFHENCFYTNRLYLLETTEKSRRTQTGISNYREIRRKRQQPRSLTDEERVMYNAASNETMLMGQRLLHVSYPLLTIAVLCVPWLTNPLAIVLVVCDLITYMFTPPLVHDVVVDLLYALSSLLYADMHYKYTIAQGGQ